MPRGSDRRLSASVLASTASNRSSTYRIALEHSQRCELNVKAYLSDSAATPGSTLPSRSSSEAPPPVDTCVTCEKEQGMCLARRGIAAAGAYGDQQAALAETRVAHLTLSSVPYFLQQVAVSPPPMTVTTPLVVASTTASIIDLVPFSKEAISKTPIGPFQMMVLEDMMTCIPHAVSEWEARGLKNMENSRGGRKQGGESARHAPPCMAHLLVECDRLGTAV